jgi:hypothetical protein
VTPPEPDAGAPTAPGASAGRAPDAVRADDRVAGAGIVTFGWLANAVFAATAVPAAIFGGSVLDDVAIGTALVLFFLAIAVFVYAFALALARTTRGDDIAVASLFFLQGSAPPAVRRTFTAQLVVCLAIAAGTAAWQFFSVLVPMLPIGLAGLWAARYGTFPPRVPAARRTRPPSRR